MNPNQLEQFWTVLNQHLGSKSDSYREFLKIKRHYSEPHRKYHTLTHIVHGLAELNEVKDFAGNYFAIAYAFFFHDAAKTEEESAQMALEASENAGFPYSFRLNVAMLVLATKHTMNIGSDDPDGQIIKDIDLSILGQPENVFDEYERQIAQEYSWVKPPKLYLTKRLEVLDTLIRRTPLFLTPYFQKKYEAQAKCNLARSISLNIAARKALKA